MSSLITRCPACATMFKVVPDQLRVSDGWVRCGQCNEVFDANSQLQPRGDAASTVGGSPSAVPQRLPDLPEPESVPVPVPAPAPAPAPAPLAVEQVDAAAVAGFNAEALVEAASPAKPEEKIVASVQHALDAQCVEEPLLESNPRVQHIDVEAESTTVSPSSRPTTLGEQRSSLGHVEKTRHVRKRPVTSRADESPRASFMRAGKGSAPRRRTSVQAMLWGAALVLVSGLVLQVAFHERDRIAATDPSALRLLEPLCEVLDCKIGALRQIESIVIDGSSFAKVRADVYRLNFTLKNTAQTPIATPAVELTLTDLQDQPVVRRVFVAGDFGRHQLVLEPGVEWVASFPVSVRQDLGSAKVSGYRLLTFYP